MKLLAPGLSIVIGLAAGVLMSRSMHQPATVKAAAAAAKSEQRPVIAAPAFLPSSDTLEILKDPDLPGRVGRVAVWLPHAELPEVQALWESLMASNPIPSDLVTLVMSRWVVLDPQGALDANRKLERTLGGWGEWAAWDPRAAEAAARAGGDPTVLGVVLMELAGRDPDHVAKLLEQDLKLAQMLAAKVVEGFIAQRRYDRAMDAAMRFGGSSSNKEKVLREWSKEEPEQALLWGVQNRDAFLSIGEDFTQAVAREQIDKIPGILAKLPTGDVKGRIRDGYVLALADKDPAAAVRFAESGDASLINYTMLGELGRKFTTSNPTLATEILGKLLEAGRPLDEYQVAVFFLDGQRKGWHSTETPFPDFAEDLIKNMPELAMDAVMATPDKPAYQTAARQLADQWMEKDEWDFGAWLKRQPAGSLRDELAIEFAGQLAGGERPAFDQALAWASSVADAKERDRQLDSLLFRWKAEDADAVRSYLAAPGTPELIRKRASHFDKDE